MATRPRVLVAEDDEEMRTLLRRTLQHEGFEPVTARDGQEALEKLTEDEAVEVLLTDIRMPRMDGIQLLQQARGMRPALKVIVMTAYAEVEQYLDLMRGGAFDYLPKPFKIPDLVEAIDRALDRRS